MASRHPSLESLRIFETCARLGSYARAAEDLGISQTVVSSKMRALEAELGVVLFEHARPKLKLSATGKKLAADIGQAFAAIRTAIERVGEAAESGLRISVTPTIASRWLAPRLARWEVWPNATAVELDVGIPLQPIGKGQCDLAIRLGRGHWPGLAACLLMPMQLTPMMTPELHQALGSPRRSAQLLDAPLLPSDMWSRWFRETDVVVPPEKFPRIPYPAQDRLAESALAGEGIALLSPVLFRTLLTSSRLIAPFPHILSGPDAYYAVYRPTHRRTPVSTFLQWLKNEAERIE